MTARIVPLALVAAALALVAAPAGAQLLLDDVLPQQETGGVCTCAVMEPPPGPYDCDVYVAEVRADLASQVSDQTEVVMGQCVSARMGQCLAQQASQGQDRCDNVPEDLRSFCLADQGGGACNRAEITQICQREVDQGFSTQIAPILTEQRNSCAAANREAVQGWVEHCETVDRPANCATCTEENDRIVELEREIADAQAWLTSMRTGAALISADDEAVIAQRLDDIDRWQRELSSRRTSYQMLQETDFCPTP